MDAGLVVHSLAGFFLLHVIAWVFSENRRTIAWRPVTGGMLLTFGLGLLLLKAPYAKDVFLALNSALNALEKATQDGTSFVFGFLGGGPLPFAETYPGASFVLAFRALPLVLVVSALSALLFYWRVLPWIEGVFPSLAKDHGSRRRDRLVLRGERVRRHGRGPAGRQALYPEYEPR